MPSHAPERRNKQKVQRREKAGVIDPMCVGQNCYAEISFCIDGFTMSGMHVDESAIAIQPGTNASVTAGVELHSDRYLIWNRYGTVRWAIQPPQSAVSKTVTRAWR